MKRSVQISIIVFTFIAFMTAPKLSLGADSNSSAKIKKTPSNLNFNVPDDWPIEERNGALGPIPIEEYLGLKFAGVNDKLAKSEKLTTELEQRVKALEELLKKPRKLREGAAEENESERI